MTRFEHGREAGGLLFLALPGAGLFEAPMQADLLQRLFAVQFLFEPPQRFIDGLASF